MNMSYNEFTGANSNGEQDGARSKGITMEFRQASPAS